MTRQLVFRMGFILDLEIAFKDFADDANRVPMESYMKNKFQFFGIKSVKRKQLLKEVININKTEVNENIRDIVLELYKLPQREFHYCAMELVARFLKNKYQVKDTELIENLLITHSHWDSVDFIAKHVLGNYLLHYPEQIKKGISHFSSSTNMWLNRSAILFQLGYKENTNANVLFTECKNHSKSKEFFIQKAIGWALREYAKTNPDAVKKFVDSTKLAPLSKKEALKHFKQ